MSIAFQNASLRALAHCAIAIAIVGCAPAAPNGPAAPPTDSRQASLGGVQWLVAPHFLYPVEAQLARVSSGSVTLRCHAEPSGRLADCEVLEESPSGMGFAEAGIRAVRSARLANVESLGPDRLVTFTLGGTMSDPGTPIELASPNGATGQVELNCRFLNDGGLSDCRVTSETPEGAGLSQAALNAVDEIPIVLPPHWRSGPRVSFTINYSPPATNNGEATPPG